MIWYVAIVAIVNLALGYALANVLSARREGLATTATGATGESDPQ
jgi:hypothetical protein